MNANPLGSDNVIAVTFAEQANTYEALSKLKELEAQGRIDVRGAAVVVRNEDGHVAVKDQTGDSAATGTATGGLVGLLIGILGGPFGILLGGATGLLIGSLFDLDDVDETESVLTELSKTVQVGRTALLADVSEQSPEVVDSAMAALGGDVVRRSVDDVEAEIAAAESAQREAKRAARKALHEARHKARMEEIQAKVEELKAKLGRHEKAAAVS